MSSTPFSAWRAICQVRTGDIAITPGYNWFMDAFLPLDALHSYRSQTFRTAPGLRLTSRDEAVAYVNQRGFVYFWPITGVLLPSLWTAVAGDRPVADAHDDPGHITWGWKDALLGGREWYYAKVLRKKATMIAFDLLPCFYALSENYGAYEEDYLTLYEQGRLTMEARQVYEALLEKGPLDTVTLRRQTGLSSPAAESRFNRAITDLQADFKIVPSGVTDAGAWHYAFAYDITARRYPELPDLAQPIRERTARCRLAEALLRSLGALQARDLVRLFGWRPADAARALADLLAGGAAVQAQVENQSGEWLVLSSLFPV